MRRNRQNLGTMLIVAGNQNRRRSSTGSSFIELALTIMIITGMVLFALDICMLMIAYGINDRACRDAARAASRARNQGEAMNLAAAAIRYHDIASALIDNPTIDQSAFKFVPNPSGALQPYVSVTTRTNTRVPAPIFMLGTQIGGDQVAIAKQYTFPLMKISKKQFQFDPNLLQRVQLKNLAF